MDLPHPVISSITRIGPYGFQSKEAAHNKQRFSLFHGNMMLLWAVASF